MDNELFKNITNNSKLGEFLRNVITKRLGLLEVFIKNGSDDIMFKNGGNTPSEKYTYTRI